MNKTTLKTGKVAKNISRLASGSYRVRKTKNGVAYENYTKTIKAAKEWLTTVN